MASRHELFSKLGLNYPVVDPILDAVYEAEEQQIWEENLFSAPHGEKWHTSFHASSFPGDDEKACGRKATYELMDIPSETPIDRQGRAVMEAGKALEEQVVWRLARSGLLISPTPDAEFQLGFTDAEYWLTGSPDSVINLPKKNRPHVIEIKSKKHEYVEEMKIGKRSFDSEHRRQALTYIGFTKEHSTTLWPELEECSSGSLAYFSRDMPSLCVEYRFEFNPQFMAQGKKRLKDWKEAYLEERLPPRPKEWRWTETPCKWCKFKRKCKQDVKDEVEKLPESNTIIFAKEVRKDYDYEETRQEVLDRWDGEK